MLWLVRMALSMRVPRAMSEARRFGRDTGGQDLVEYALLVATIGVVGAATMPLLEDAIGIALTLMTTQTQDQWIPPNPGP